MKPKINKRFFLMGGLLFVLIACNQTAKTDEMKADTATTTKTETSTMPAYDPAMDPVNVEANFVKMIKDSLNIKFYEITLKPGDSVALHTHPDNMVYVLEGGTVNIYPKDAAMQVVEFKKGTGLVGGPVTHSGKNVGSSTIRLLIADVYRPRS